MNGFHRAALVCALGPFVVGTLVFFSWLRTRGDSTAVAGLGVVLAGLVLLALGLLLLVFAVRADLQAGRPTLKPTLGVLALLLLNLPIAAAMTVFGLGAAFSHRVTVVNESEHPLGALTFIDPSQGELPFPEVPAHARVERQAVFHGEGQVRWQGFLDGARREGLLLGYVSGNGGVVTLTVHPDGGVTTAEE